MIICILSDFCSSTHCKTVYERLNQPLPPFYFPTYEEYLKSNLPNKIHIVAFEQIQQQQQIQPAITVTHLILLNKAKIPSCFTAIPPERVLGLAFEPPFFLRLQQNDLPFIGHRIGKYLIGDEAFAKQGNTFIAAATRWPERFQPHFGFLWYNPLPSLQTINKRPGSISMMISEKTHTEGHRLRHLLAQAILKTDLPVDFYGRGCSLHSATKDKRLKGTFTETEPYNSYEYHIAIENTALSHYYSEKIINPLLSNTKPIYWGCRTILDTFPDCGIMPFQTVEDAMALIRQAAAAQPVEQTATTILERQHGILEKVGLIHQLPNILQ